MVKRVELRRLLPLSKICGQENSEDLDLFMTVQGTEGQSSQKFDIDFSMPEKYYPESTISVLRQF